MFLIFFDAYLCELSHSGYSGGGYCQIQGWMLIFWILISALPCLIALILATISLRKYNDVKKATEQIGKFRKFNHYMTIIFLMFALLVVCFFVAYFVAYNYFLNP